MKKSGLADSPFFTIPQKKSVSTSLSDKPPVAKQKMRRKAKYQKTSPTKLPRHHDTMIPRNRDTMVSRHHDTIIESIRKTVKEIGKEAATHRFTIEEKKAIAQVVFTHKNQGTITSENQIARIAVNYIIKDYNENGENSILSKVLRALNE